MEGGVNDWESLGVSKEVKTRRQRRLAVGCKRQGKTEENVSLQKDGKRVGRRE